MSDLDERFRQARRDAFRIVGAQACVTLLGAAGGLLLAGTAGSVSAFLGGGIGTLASLVQVAGTFRPGASREPAKILGRLFRGEAFKLLTAAGLFALVLMNVEVVFGAMIGGFGATLLVFWAALLRGTGDALAGGIGRQGRK